MFQFELLSFFVLFLHKVFGMHNAFKYLFVVGFLNVFLFGVLFFFFWGGILSGFLVGGFPKSL